MMRHADWHIRYEMDDAVRRRAEAIVIRCELVIHLFLRFVDHLPEVRIALAVRAKVENRVRALARHDVRKWKQLFSQVQKHGKKVLPGSRHDSESQLVVKLSGRRRPFREKLCVRRIEILAAADEFRDGEPLTQHRAYDAIYLLFDEVKQVAIANGEAKQQLSSCKMMNDLHCL